MAKILHYSVKIEERGERGTYLGKAKVYRVYGGYEIRIPDFLCSLSATGKLALYPSWLFLLFHKGMLVKIRIREKERLQILEKCMLCEFDTKIYWARNVYFFDEL